MLKNNQNQTWYSMAAKGSHGTIYIYEEIGYWGVTAARFAKELVDLGDIKTITLHLNTPGGSVGDGTAIYNVLKNHEAIVTVEIDGYALSMGSIIALAGDVVKMADNALFMIHNPWGVAFGDADEMRKSADINDKHKEAMLNTYQAKTGLERNKLSQMMDDETWFTATEALNSGFIDEVTGAIELVATANTQQFIHNLDLKNQPNNFLNAQDNVQLNFGLITAFKKFVSNFNNNQEKQEKSTMNIDDLKALFSAKTDSNKAYQVAAEANPDLAKQIDVKKSELAAEVEVEDDAPDSDNTAVLALSEKVESLTTQLATTNKNHEDLIAKLALTVESFNRDEADGSADSNTSTDGVY
jgi:ATP-dependent Clp endopeptidase proteolytic subunit ClpP